jgi:uncharacterized phage protein (TIGR01671 family)
MREIKFRGKNKHTGPWHYGSLLNPTEGYHFPQIWDWQIDVPYPVLEETVGESTGLLDKDGKEIYEGDVVRWSGNFETRVVCYESAVHWGQGGWDILGAEVQGSRIVELLGEVIKDEQANVEIIGNIYEHGHLLERNNGE